MWDHHKITIKTHFGRMISMKKDSLVKTRFFKKKFPTCREILAFQANFFFHDFFPKFGDFLSIWPLY